MISLTKQLQIHLNTPRIALCTAVLLAIALQCSSRCALAANEQSDKKPETLELGRVVERQIASGQMHSYQLLLSANQYLDVHLDQQGIDVKATLFSPDGVKLSETQLNHPPFGRKEFIKTVTSSSGAYRLVVQPTDEVAGAGKYTIAIKELRVATKDDAARVPALETLHDAMSLLALHKPQSTQQAVERFEEARELWHAVPDPVQEAGTLYLLGDAYNQLGEYEKGVDSCDQALVIWRSLGKCGDEAGPLTVKGESYYYLSEYQKALDCYEQALQLCGTEEKDIGLVAWTMNNIGSIYDALGEPQKALDYYGKSLAICEKLGREGDKGRGIAIGLTNIGGVYASLGESEKALDHLVRALPEWRSAGDRWGEARIYHRIGVAYASSGNDEKALEAYKQALEVWREVGDPFNEAKTLNALGLLHYFRSEKEEAFAYFTKALAIRKSIQDRQGEANSLFQIARVERDGGNLLDARTNIDLAIETAESVRARVASDESRSAYLAAVREYYEFYVDLLMRLHRLNTAGAFDAMAIKVSERARARSLIEMLAEARADIRQGVDPILVERERDLQRRLNGKAEYKLRLLRGNGTEEQVASVEKEIDALSTAYQQLKAQIRVSSPRYAALTQPAPLTLDEIQQQVLDSSTLLLEYALGDMNSYLWVVSDRSMTVHQLPNRTEVEKVARRVYESLTERNRRVKGETSHQRRARVARADRDYVNAAAALSRIVLGPAASELGNKRLLIVADGALQYIPFAALPAPSARGLGDRRRGLVSVVAHAASLRDKWSKTTTKDPPTARNRAPSPNPQPLIVRHEIISLPSASALAVLRRELKDRKPAAKSLALLADPVFSPSDARVRALAANRSAQRSASGLTKSDAVSQTTPRDLQHALRDVGESDWSEGIPRLLGTRWEAEQIMSLVPKGDRLIALDFAANRETATSAEIGNYRIVHFASHALIDSVHPELSGIMLSLVDEQGRPRDGFLRSHEIFNLKLPADLVVLNACRTGLGKEVRGEGLIGLTRGFMYAGAARVLVSLWSLEDRSATELMKRMYENMLGPKHLSPAAALRAAQIEMWKQPGSQSPYFWAGYSLQGEWR